MCIKFQALDDSLIFSFINTGLDETQSKIAVFGKSIDDIMTDLSNGRGVINSLFKASISDSELVNITDFINIVSQLPETAADADFERAWSQTMKDTSEAAQEAAINVWEGKTSLDELAHSTLNAQKAFQVFKNTLLNVGITFLSTIAISAVVSFFMDLAKAQEEARQAAVTAAQDYDKQNEAIETTTTRIRELRTELDSGTLSELDAYKAKKELLDIQNNLATSYGEQAAGIDLLNGKLETQIGLVKQLTVADAENYLNENRSAILKAEQKMTDNLGLGNAGVQLGILDNINTPVMQEFKTMLEGYENIKLDRNFFTGNYEIKFHGNADEAKKVLNELMTETQDLLDRSMDKLTSNDTWVISDVLTNAEKHIKTSNEILENYQHIYQAAQEARLITDQNLYEHEGESGTAAKWLRDYAEAVQNYNDALLDDDPSKTREAKNAFVAIDTAVQALLRQDGMKQYADQFNDVKDQLNTTSAAHAEFVDSINGKEQTVTGKSIKEYSDLIKELGMTDAQFLTSAFIDSDEVDQGTEAVQALISTAQDMGLIADSAQLSEAEVQSLVDTLVNAGVLISTLPETVAESPTFSTILDEHKEELDTYIEQIDKLGQALSKSRSGELDPSERFELEYEFPDLRLADDFEEGILNEISKIQGTLSLDGGVSTGINGLLYQIYSQIDKKDPEQVKQYLHLAQSISNVVSEAKAATPVFKNYSEALSSMGDYADLYQSMMDFDLGFSIDTIASARDLLGEHFEEIFVFSDGEYQLVEGAFEKLQQIYVDGLMAVTDLPEGMDRNAATEWVKETWEDALEASRDAETQLEKLSKAFEKVQNISSFMTEAGFGEMGYLEMLESATDLLEDLPYGTKLQDLFKFSPDDIKVNEEFLNAQLDARIDSMLRLANLDKVASNEFKTRIKQEMQEQQTLEKYSNTIDKASNASSLLSRAQEEMSASGKNSVDTYSELLDLFGTEAEKMVTIGADGIVINQQAVKDKMRSEIDEVFGDNALGKQLKDQLEVEIETASFDDALDNYTSKTETLKDALDTLKTEDLSESDYFELIREFPELTKYTDDLSTGIKTLLSQNVDEISKAFDTQIDLADTPEKVAQLQELKRAALELAALEDVKIVIDVEAETEGFEKLQTAISESASATGMSADSVEALRLRYSGLMGTLSGSEKLFQRTANGITLNTQAAQKLERAYQTKQFKKVDRDLESLSAQYDVLTDRIANCSDAAARSQLLDQQGNIAKQIQDLADLRAQYAGLTSSFNAWQSAQSSANERDNYESVGSGYEEMKKLFDGGWYGDDSLNSYLDLMFGADRQKDIQSMTAQMEKLGKMNERYWTKDKDGNSTTDGLFNFLDDLEKNQETQGIIQKTVDEAGETVYGFDFSAENIEKISKAFGMSAEMVGLFASALSDAGGNVTFYDEYADKIVGIGRASDSTKKKIAEIGKEAGVTNETLASLMNYDIESMTRQEIQSKLDEYETEIQLHPEFETPEVQAEMDRLSRQDVTLAINAELESGDKSIDELLDLSPEQLTTELNIDDSQVEAAKAQLESLKATGAEVAMTVKIDEGQLAQLTDDEKEGTVVYDADMSAADAAPAPPKDGIVTYTPDFVSMTPPTLYGTVIYKSQGITKADGTAHANGTAHGMAFARGNWGTPSSGVALGGELGQETIVRDGQFFTIGDHGAEFFQYQKGDINK